MRRCRERTVSGIEPNDHIRVAAHCLRRTVSAFHVGGHRHRAFADRVKCKSPIGIGDRVAIWLAVAVHPHLSTGGGLAVCAEHAARELAVGNLDDERGKIVVIRLRVCRIHLLLGVAVTLGGNIQAVTLSHRQRFHLDAALFVGVNGLAADCKTRVLPIKHDIRHQVCDRFALGVLHAAGHAHRRFQGQIQICRCLFHFLHDRQLSFQMAREQIKSLVLRSRPGRFLPARFIMSVCVSF